jgi:carbonic anhydrase
MATNINITQKNVIGNCDLKCSYTFKYPESSLVAINNDVMFSFTYDNGSVSPVIYNTQKYKVDKIMIVAPSIHLFNGKKCDSEIIIQHIPDLGGNILSVSIPIIESTNTSPASNMITQILEKCIKNIPSNKETTTIDIDGFTLNDIIPVKPYYSYTYEKTDWIIFDTMNAIPINNSILKNINKIIQPFNLPTPSNNDSLFYNKNGPNMTKSIGEGIYISCQPTGNSKENMDVVYSKDNSNNNLSSMFSTNSTAFLVIISFVIILVIIGLLNFGYNYFFLSNNNNNTINNNYLSKVSNIFKRNQ